MLTLTRRPSVTRRSSLRGGTSVEKAGVLGVFNCQTRLQCQTQ